MVTLFLIYGLYQKKDTHISVSVSPSERKTGLKPATLSLEG